MDSRLIPDEQTAPIVREPYERKAGGGTWLELARWLDTAAPKPDGRHWARSSVATIIRCETYLGQVRHGDNVQADTHEAIVSPALWRRAQNEPGRRTPRGTYLLGGLVRCAGCGRAMQGSLRNGARLYVCRSRDCSACSSVRTALLDTEVVTRFFDRLEHLRTRAIEDDEIARAQAAVERLTGEVERLAAITPTHPAAVSAHQREQREILRGGIDTVLVRRSVGSGPASRIGERALVLFRSEAPVELLNGRGLARNWLSLFGWPARRGPGARGSDRPRAGQPVARQPPRGDDSARIAGCARGADRGRWHPAPSADHVAHDRPWIVVGHEHRTVTLDDARELLRIGARAVARAAVERRARSVAAHAGLG